MNYLNFFFEIYVIHRKILEIWRKMITPHDQHWLRRQRGRLLDEKGHKGVRLLCVLCGLVGVVALDFLFRDLLRVDGTPGVDDVGQDEGHEQRDVEHRAQGELTGAGVDHRQRRLEVGGRGIVGRVVPGRAEQQGQDGEDSADAGGPDAADVILRHDGLADTEKHEDDTY